MNSDRSQAYGRVVRTIEDVGASKLLDSERELVRATADSLFFCEDLSTDPDARAAVSEISALCRRLVESDRWLDESARGLLRDVLACGPDVNVGASLAPVG
jgi:hypothetical protein